MSQEVQFTPVNTGDMGDIPPDAPVGAWNATAAVKKAKTKQDGFPMLVFEFTLVEALTEGNEDYQGVRVSDFVPFFPRNHKAFKMGAQRFKGLCESLGVEMPASTASLAKGSWEDLEALIAEVDGSTNKVFTVHEQDKRTGEIRTSVRYKAPAEIISASSEDDEADEPVKTPAKKNGKKNGRH